MAQFDRFQLPKWRDWTRPPWLNQMWAEICRSYSYMVIATCICIFVVLGLFNAIGLVSWQQSIAIFGLSFQGVTAHFYIFQFLTAPFFHVSSYSLGFNMLSLYLIGPQMEARLGARCYLELSVLSALSWSVGCFILSSLGDGDSIGCGYFGAICGLIVGFAILSPDQVVRIWGVWPLTMKHLAIILILFGLLASISPGGAITGLSPAFSALAALWYLRWGGSQRMSSLRYPKWFSSK
jgi:membrane associated rhomboid family serine protease